MSKKNMEPKNIKNPSGPIATKDWVVEVDRDACIGASACLLADRSFALDDEGKAIILGTIDEEERETLLDAARVCTVLAIKIKNKETGETIYPE